MASSCSGCVLENTIFYALHAAMQTSQWPILFPFSFTSVALNLVLQNCPRVLYSVSMPRAHWKGCDFTDLRRAQALEFLNLCREAPLQLCLKPEGFCALDGHILPSLMADNFQTINTSLRFP